MKMTVLFAALVLAGCAAPPLTQPVIDIPAQFQEGASWKTAQPAEAQARGQWWKVFHDGALDALIAEAGEANANLAVAAARVKQARALAGMAQADRVPAIGAQIGGQRNRVSEAASGVPDGLPAATVWQGKLTASYEVDLFGRVGNQVSAARADAEGALATLQSVLLALQADVAQTYFRLRALDAERALMAQTVNLRDENVRINQRRYELGDLGELDLARAKTELSAARAEAAAIERERAQLAHALAVLLGRPAPSFQLAAQPLPKDLAMPVIPAGVPSALLERRADIASAQQAMVAANARIGVARAARFPLLQLSAAGGGEAATLANVFKAGAGAWAVGGLLSLPLIDGGRNRANIERSQAQLEESAASYRQTVLSAFADVENQLSGLRTLDDQTRAIDDAVASARRSVELAGKLNAAGRTSYLDVIDAQRNLAAIERNAVQLRGARAVTTVGLIRALGGAW
ncbi:MAG TPA: efflux transporter outer membrane subunit [Burkholderiaceae bacterium]